MDVTTFRKALVPIGVAVVLALLSKLGITGNMSVQDAVSLVLTAGLVYLTPNNK